jgi:hypothetical protein
MIKYKGGNMKKLFTILFLTTFVIAWAQSNHTVTFTGNPANDFNPSEKYTSGPVDYYATFDATTLYLGAKNNTGGNFGSADVFTIYIDTDPQSTPTAGTGTTAGNLYNGVTPTLPFSANFTIKVEESYNESRAYSGGWGGTTGFETVSTASNAREVKISFANLGNPSSIYLIMWMGYSNGYFAPAPTSNLPGPSGTPVFTNYFGTIPITSGVTPLAIQDTPLPVELTSFIALAEKNRVELNWSTATEVNNYGFDIERCVAQIGNLCNNWEKIGFVQGHGNSNSPKDYSFVDANPPAGKVLYKLKQIDFDGTFEYSKAVEVNVETPQEFRLAQNYPNPFNPSTVINYQLPKDGNVTLKVYDMLGREVATLVNEYQKPGIYNYKFSIDNYQLPSGIYIYQLKAGNFIETKKLMILK